MKKLFGLTVGLFLISLMFMGCNNSDSGDDLATPKSYVKYNNKTYELDKGVIFSDSLNEKNANANLSAQMAYPVGVMLTSSGLKLYSKGGILDSISGTGNGIVFNTYSSVLNDLQEGEYVFDSTSLGKAGVVFSANAVFDFNALTGKGIQVYLVSGKLNVKKDDGGNYEITFDCKGTDGKTIEGYYSGPLKSFFSSSISGKAAPYNGKEAEAHLFFKKAEKVKNTTLK